MRDTRLAFACLLVTLRCGLQAPGLAAAEPARPRARDLGVPFEGVPGPLNAITDVAGVTVGHTTLISGEGKLEVGKGPVRTGVTAILPRGKETQKTPVFGAWFSLNGNGELTGTAWIRESGFIEGPILFTNTHSVGVVRDAAIAWRVKNGPPDATGTWWSLPVVGETWDGYLNDVNGFHVKPEHVFAALEGAAGGAVAEGGVGGGTGMVCHEFKGGIGTASRVVTIGGGRPSAKEPSQAYALGVLVQANYGLRAQLRIAGVPVGLEIPENAPYSKEAGSILIAIATDAPLLPHQLERLARRASMGLARMGSVSGNGSGDLFLAFSTANAEAGGEKGPIAVKMLTNDEMNPFFTATLQAVEEAIVNALVAGETMTGVDGHRVIGLPHEKLREVLKRYNRLAAR